MPRATISITQTGVQIALRGFIIGALPDVEVILGQVNRVPEPSTPDFIVYWPRSQERLATNILSYIDTIVVGSIAGTILTVDSVTQGVVLPGAILTNQDDLITVNTAVVSQLSGSTGGTGTYKVLPSQTFGTGVIRAGVRYDTVPTQAMMQLDVHGPNSWNNTKIIETLFRSIYGVDSFAATGIEVAPLYCNEPKQIPFENAEQQYEDRWVIEACLQFNPAVGTPQQFADVLQIDLIDAVTAYPP